MRSCRAQAKCVNCICHKCKFQKEGCKWQVYFEPDSCGAIVKCSLFENKELIQ